MPDLASPEALSREIARAILFNYGLPYRVCALPALILAAFNRALPVALTLCILAVWRLRLCGRVT
jgi:hypothetical protein